MKTETFTRRSWINVGPEIAFEWHARPGAFERLSPPWRWVEIVGNRGGIETGARLDLLMKVGPFRRHWIAEHTEHVPGRLFRDVQRRGPFAHWQHTHRFEPDGRGAWLVDQVEYAVPGGALGKLCAGSFVRRELERLFRYRHSITLNDLTLHAAQGGSKIMHVAVTGATGLVGSSLVALLTSGGHRVTRLVRQSSRTPTPGVSDSIWSPDSGQIDRSALEGVDAVVHLAGENIAAGRWTAAQKARIRESRVKGTRLLSETLAGLARPPKVFVSASAIGWYGDRGSEGLSEASSLGTGFLAEVCRDWEAAVEPAEGKGIRVVKLRIGVVLSPKGGALAKMLMPFKLGAGGVMGNGQQIMSWISLDDLVGAIHHALVTESLHGPVNAVSPQPVTNRVLTKTLGRVLSRPTLFPIPAFLARILFGEMADETILSSASIAPKQLLSSGYKFRHPELEGALRHLLGR